MAVKAAGKAKNHIHHILCKEIGYGCDARFEGKNDDKLVVQAVEHLAQFHGATLSPELAAQVRQLIS
jgi:predicted small metal-binding protein